MSYQVLARKWRPKKFEDVVGQIHITRSLQNAILKNKLGHAYLMAGTRGIGKTSIARLLAKAIRCENKMPDGNSCSECTSCLDSEKGSSMNVLEIDGASNNSVDDIRGLVENVQYLPTSGNYKVYIIDEVHMLSTSAFNALLKTLEEPPKHIIFILATTEPQKLPRTVLSRCQRFDFRNASVADLVAHLRNIAVVEGIKFDNDDLIKQIATQGNGSVRDTLSLLDQVLCFTENDHISEDVLTTSLGLAKKSSIKIITSAILRGEGKEVSRQYLDLTSRNISVKNILLSVLDHLFQGISLIDDPKKLEEEGFLDANALDDISSAELFWVYESLAKDASWSLESIDPMKVCHVLLQKVSYRRDFLSNKRIVDLDSKKKTLIPNPKKSIEEDLIKENDISSELLEIKGDLSLKNLDGKSIDGSNVQTKKETIVDEVEPSIQEEVNVAEVESPVEEEVSVAEVESPIEKEISIDKVVPGFEEEINADKVEPSIQKESTPENEIKNWENFLSYLKKTSPVSASNLEQGNLISPLIYANKKLSLTLGFSASNKVFFDYLNEPETIERLKGFLRDYFQCHLDAIDLNLSSLDQETQDKSQFISRADIQEKKEEEEVKVREKEFRSNPLVQQAENLFGVDLDRVVIPRNKK